MLCFSDEVAQWQHERGRHGDRTAWMLENLLTSFAWRQEPVQATLEMLEVGTVVTNGCVWEKRRPDRGDPIRNPIMFHGIQGVVSAVDIRSARDHEHSVIDGGMRWADGQGQWKRSAISE